MTLTARSVSVGAECYNEVSAAQAGMKKYTRPTNRTIHPAPHVTTTVPLFRGAGRIVNSGVFVDGVSQEIAEAYLRFYNTQKKKKNPGEHCLA